MMTHDTPVNRLLGSAEVAFSNGQYMSAYDQLVSGLPIDLERYCADVWLYLKQRPPDTISYMNDAVEFGTLPDVINEAFAEQLSAPGAGQSIPGSFLWSAPLDSRLSGSDHAVGSITPTWFPA